MQISIDKFDYEAQISELRGDVAKIKQASLVADSGPLLVCPCFPPPSPGLPAAPRHGSTHRCCMHTMEKYALHHHSASLLHCHAVLTLPPRS